MASQPVRQRDIEGLLYARAYSVPFLEAVWWGFSRSEVGAVLAGAESPLRRLGSR